MDLGDKRRSAPDSYSRKLCREAVVKVAEKNVLARDKPAKPLKIQLDLS